MNAALEAFRATTIPRHRRHLRQMRLHNWTWRQRKARATRFKERFGLDVSGDPAAVAEARRLMRNARKQERADR